MLLRNYVPQLAFIPVLCFATLAQIQVRAQAQVQAPSYLSASTVPAAQQIQPAELIKLLSSPGGAPLVIQVGSRIFFEEAHIPGAKYAGPGSQPSGIQALEKTVAAVSKDKFIVLYCGCCPWDHCPNIGPAYKRLIDLGYTNVKVLYLANNFGDDWVRKGYPREH